MGTIKVIATHDADLGGWFVDFVEGTLWNYKEWSDIKLIRKQLEEDFYENMPKNKRVVYYELFFWEQ